MSGRGNHLCGRWVLLSALLRAVVLIGSALALPAYSATPSGPVIPPASGEQCVADTDLMRSDHMALLKHQRDETVIEGKRENPFSLVGCVNCHAQTSADGSPIRIDAEGQFCESCHSYAAVKIDCFSCHAAVPEKDKVIGLLDTVKPAPHEILSFSMLPDGLQNPITWADHQTHGKHDARVNAD